MVRAAREAEFDTISLNAPGGEIAEVRFFRTDEPHALVVRHAAGALVGSWDAPGGGPAPTPPPQEEVRRRFALAADLFVKAREALGLKDFRGGRSGTVTLQLRGVEDLLPQSLGPEADYEYRFYGLGQKGRLEDLRVDAVGARYHIEWGSELAAEQLLGEGLAHVRAARSRLQITFGRDAGSIRLP